MKNLILGKEACLLVLLVGCDVAQPGPSDERSADAAADVEQSARLIPGAYRELNCQVQLTTSNYEEINSPLLTYPIDGVGDDQVIVNFKGFEGTFFIFETLPGAYVVANGLSYADRGIFSINASQLPKRGVDDEVPLFQTGFFAVPGITVDNAVVDQGYFVCFAKRPGRVPAAGNKSVTVEQALDRVRAHFGLAH